ncbi:MULTISPECIES: cytochrome c oxidase subunit I [Halobacterium]|uniref:Cytochrome c oxidase polypeptide 1 n=5 Tax=Halobacterium salinarum TaxID=2242 RepID=COX1_HALSA|nr:MULTISPECIES: cytochrome c oxidase subunit I [Halobacterium]P33518.1 RecName: Full=Cytochrome c oxidase polypeptide 1; AltName: Full=Cytochrome aa3 subunit 1; AltName: Full=Cytochrome c oxidase polypeptide I [Halobacterium salinarum NRC-1]AAG19154.1 cytochrome c oxidase subunit I [Halobacterium salinarum NRC-1]MBB6089997.1 cytochrome c oxidase subunit 1 [Halobacterium salinarum]MCF2165719.1 cytochrome c oxidase subunit I [Halobacterium salinarum]MCF2166589.1 cytochrome c oxidase subunit I [
MATAASSITLTVLMGVLLVGVVAVLARLEDWRSYTPLSDVGGGLGERTGYTHEEKPGGIIRWFTTVDHKDIGILYGVYGTIAFAWGGVSVLLMRTELATSSETLISPSLYNGLLTSHGITMLFLFGTPMIAAFGNYFIPLLIDADDMAFPRINAIAFWLLPPGAILIWSGFLIPGIATAQTSWTMYTPLSLQMSSPAVDMMMLGLHLTGVSATMGAINFIATIFTERGEDVGWPDLDIFSWTMLTQSGLILFAFPLFGSALIMLLLDRNFGTTFFTVAGGDPIFWQHLFWFFGHPEVYVLVLPPMGIVSLILPKFSGRKLFGFKFVVYSTLAIGVLSFGVWAHHMFTTGIDPRIRSSFMAVSLAISIPSAVKVFNWITTMWNGKLRLTAPMLFCIGFVQNFIIGGVTGVFLAVIPIDLILHDTYYVVGHFHFIVYGAIGFALFAASYYWFPMVTGRMYQKRLAHAHFWTALVGSNATFLAMLWLGYGGMPRRYATYIPQFATAHRLATVGAFLIGVSTLIWLFNMATSWREGPRVDSTDPWDLEETDQFTNDWAWFRAKEETTVLPDGGDEAQSEADAVTDGGQPAADSDTES